jgi:ABC-type Na+ transport system ATPase subunit NatA
MNDDQREIFDQKYGSIFQGTKQKTELATAIISLLKNLILALMVTWYDKQPVISIFTIMISVTI